MRLELLGTVLLAFVPLSALPGPQIGSTVSARLFADGSVECTGADDHSEPVGTALLRATELGIGFRVILKQAAPNWTYYVELSQDGDCSAPKKFFGLKTDIDGKGVLEGICAADAGPHAILVDVVSHVGGSVPPNPKYREIAPAALMHVTLPRTGVVQR